MISEAQIDQVRQASDIVQVIGQSVQLRQRGHNFSGLCPFHHEKTPSFNVNADAQYFHCFGCGVGGDVFTYLMKHDNMEFVEAVRYLADKAGIALDEGASGPERGHKARLQALCEATAEFYQKQLLHVKSPGGDAARAYLHDRKLGGALSKQWQLGYAPGRRQLCAYLSKQGYKMDEMIEANVAYKSQRTGNLEDRFYNRVMFPIHDADGKAIAFGGRVIGQGEPKYLNSSDTTLFSKRRNLYALDRAKAQMTAKGSAVVVEGYTDVIFMHQAGFDNTVATLGTSLTIEHVRILARYTNRIIYLFDGDAAGQNAAKRAAGLITADILPEKQRRPFELYAAVLPDGLDPADMISQRGAEAMQAVLTKPIPLLRFAIDSALAAFDLGDFSARSRALPAALAVILPIRGSLLADDYLTYIADRLGADRDTVKGTFLKLKGPSQSVTETGQGSVGGSQTVSGRAPQRGERDAAQTTASGQSGVPLSPEQSHKAKLLATLTEKVAERALPQMRVLLHELMLAQLQDRINWQKSRLGESGQDGYAIIAQLQKDVVAVRRSLAALPKV